jgi:DNA invertase Pin-like site-specific DNA recombinase
MFQMLRVFAEFEREMIRERINSGLDPIRGEGRVRDQSRPHD